MDEVAYLASTGEIKIPLRVRTQLGLRDGEKFTVTARGQNLMLKRMGLPSAEQVREFIALRQAQKARRVVRVRAPRSTRRKLAKARTRAATARSVGRGRQVVVRHRKR